MQLRIDDDGRGGIAIDGNGLSGMRERIAALGGTLAHRFAARAGHAPAGARADEPGQLQAVRCAASHDDACGGNIAATAARGMKPGHVRTHGRDGMHAERRA